MEKLLARLKVFSIEYDVVECDLQCDSDVVLQGDVDFIKQVIRIERGLSKEKKNQVLLHEIIHCICEELGLEIRDNEAIVQGLACGLSNIFPDVISF